MSVLVVEERLAASLAGDARQRLAVVRRGRRRGRGGWAPLEADAVVELLDASDPGALVLARPAEADPGAAPLAAVARLMGREAIRLPPALERACWVVGVAVAWAPEEGPMLVRPLQALAGAAEAGTAEARPPVLRPDVLARWAARAWRPCARCRGGGAAGAPCGRCGAIAGGRP